MIKRSLFLLCALCIGAVGYAQTSATFTVNGDLNKYYPVSFRDVNFSVNKETSMEICRANVNTNAQWRGALMSKFNYLSNNYGNGSQFINVEITSTVAFIAGWLDVSKAGTTNSILIWLKGGGTSYTISSLSNITPVIYDGVQNPLPYPENATTTHSFKTALDEYVANYVSVKQLSAYFISSAPNYFYGNVGIGVFKPTEKLAVNGNIRAREIKVETQNWPDYVFKKDYQLPTLEEIEQHIIDNGHLPGIPSADDVEKNGVELGESRR